MVTNGHNFNNLSVSQGALSHLNEASSTKPNNSDIKSLQTALHVLSTQEEFAGKEFTAVPKNTLLQNQSDSKELPEDASSALLSQDGMNQSAEISIDVNSYDFPADLEVSDEISPQVKNEVLTPLLDTNILENISSTQDKELEISINLDEFNFSDLDGEITLDSDNTTNSVENSKKEDISILVKEKPISNDIGKTKSQRLDSLEIKYGVPKIKELTIAIKLKVLEDVANDHVETSIHNNVPVQVNRLSRTGIIIIPSSMSASEAAAEAQRHQDRHRGIQFDVFVAPDHELESFVQELKIRIDIVNEQKQKVKEKNDSQTTPELGVRESADNKTTSKRLKKNEKDNTEVSAILSQQEANKKHLEAKQRLQDIEVATIKKHEKLLEELQQIEKFVAILFEEIFKSMLKQETLKRDVIVKATPILETRIPFIR